jgi:hypothetical protein
MSLMTTLATIFEKPVDRAIEGVIKADDEASLRLELEEYVITNEIEKQLEGFFDAYTKSRVANGAWISGFFGSGKSHLLKILALLLENRSIDGVPALDLFIDKCAHNEILRGDLKRAVAIPSKSILFNIDQKADVISKTQMDALLAVFQKVFDEMCGYYGKQGYIARFERHLDNRGVYEGFKAAYAGIAGKSWERGREEALLESVNISRAYAEASGSELEAAKGILTSYRNDYKVSIEDFAEQVNEYIQRQGPTFRLNFFIDEVGQYIADNVKLMTNLQTVAESLSTKCAGRAWIIVTAQQAMDVVIGDMTQQQENDFSKIQARFATRMPLTSTDVAEVIQRRLLKKTETGIGVLSDLYHQESGNLKTLFDFTDNTIRLQNFKDRDHFIHSYPFIPYQYTLFQLAIQGLSQHNAFEGKHSSVGERSMLGVFQEVAIHIADYDVGQVATFDLMFEGIRSALKSSVQQSIQIAEKNLSDPFAVRVLKALFLVKYVRQFKATIRNVCVLMLDRFDVDIEALQRRVEEALNLLEQQTYIQRTGDVYEFLTDEEKDVEQEIKSTDIDTTEIEKELENLIFETVIKTKKIRHAETANDYAYARRLDDRLVGREHELSINVISPFHEHAGKVETFMLQSMARDELIIVIKPDPRFINDLMMYKRTEKYVRQTRSNAQQPAVERIIHEKGAQNSGRYRDLGIRVKSLLSDARMMVRGEEVEERSADALIRITSAFQILVDKVYVNLAMLRGVTYSEDQIANYLKQAEGGLFGTEAAGLTEAEQEVLNFAQANNRVGIRTTVKAILEKFERKGYGWPYAAILCNVASLCARGKLDAKADSGILEGDKLVKALTNTQSHGNTILEPQVEFSPGQIRKLKEFHAEFFDMDPSSSEAKALAVETGEGLARMAVKLNGYANQTAAYPFIRLYYQARNLMEFIETVVRIKAPEDEIALHLLTIADEFKSDQQQAHFENIQLSCEAVGVKFSWEFDGTAKIHARHVVTDTGWKISLDRGLDIFQHYEMNNAFTLANRLQKYRSCKGFEVTYMRI